MGEQVCWRAGNHHLASSIAAFGAQVDDIVSLTDHLQVVLYHDHGVALVHQRLQNMQELLDVRQVQTGSRLVQEVERAGLRRAAQLIGQFDALRFTA